MPDNAVTAVIAQGISVLCNRIQQQPNYKQKPVKILQDQNIISNVRKILQ